MKAPAGRRDSASPSANVGGHGDSAVRRCLLGWAGARWMFGV
jgi:hypothetical protein